MMGVISEDKKTMLIHKEFDKLFDRLNLVKTEPDLIQCNWVDENNEKIFERNNWGTLWIYGCDEFSDLFYLSDIFSLTKDEFEKELLNYLNERYKNEFAERPIKKISSEDCEEYLDF